jgi:lipopolysaccharide transport system ATP-binding protein
MTSPPPAQPTSTAGDQPPVVVRAANLGKRFKIYRQPLDRLWEWLRLKRNNHTDFWAVRNVSFEVRRGHCLGIIGANGSGKSTLLKMLTGAMYPTEGTFAVEGRVLSLIELGTGLNPNLTGRQNISNAAALLGFPPNYAREKMSEIEAFAELGEFFDRQVMLYSSGMRVRLAFAMFACFKPEVFMVDEALSVGDVFFQQKCATRLRELLDEGMTMIFVSHDQSAVLNLCDEGLVLHKGQVLFQGRPEEAVSRYSSLLTGPKHKWSKRSADKPAAAAPAAPSTPGQVEAVIKHDIIGDRRDHRHGTGKLPILACRITDEHGRDTMNATLGQLLRFHILVEAHEPIDEPRVGIRLFDRFNTLVFGSGTHQLGHTLAPMAAGERIIVRFDLRMDVEPGQYTFGLGTGEPAPPPDDHNGIAHDRLELLGPLSVRLDRSKKRPFYGKAKLALTASHFSAISAAEPAAAPPIQTPAPAEIPAAPASA